MTGLLDSLHPGEEAVATGAVGALNDDCPIPNTYRGHGHAIAKSVPMKPLMSELLGKTTNKRLDRDAVPVLRMRLKDKVAIVTGSSRGIGKAIAKLFAREGAKVVVNYNASEKEATAVVEEIRREGGTAIQVKADVSKSEDVRKMVQRAVQEFGRIDILVNNAGVHVSKDLFDVTEDEWDRTIDVNLKGAYLCSKEVAPIMARQKNGKIINISSNSGEYHQTAMRYVEYVTSKAGMNGLTRSLALRLGPHIRVNAILPGYIRTEMVAHFTPEDEKMLMNETALKRFGNVEDVAYSALFLASDESDFITGELMFVTGGRGM